MLGAARSQWTDEEFRNQMEAAVREFGRDEFRQDVWDRLAEATSYLALEFDDHTAGEEMRSTLGEIDEERGTQGNRVYYLAVPPDAMPNARGGARRASRPRAAGRA